MEFKYFTRLPPEIRNEVYKLLFVTRVEVMITSPLNHRKRRPPRLDFTRLLLVNKQINAEAKTIFYSLNIFRTGNMDWAATNQPNLHALKAFTTRVPKACIAIISRITMNIRFYRRPKPPWTWSPTRYPSGPPTYEEDNRELVHLRSVARSLLKYFVGVEHINIIAGLASGSFLKGDFDRTVEAVVMMLALPNLKRMHFLIHNNDPFCTEFIQKNEVKKEVISFGHFASYRNCPCRRRFWD